MTFLIDNLYLIAIALASGGMLLWPLVRKGGGSTALSPLEATQLINHRNAIVVDVRDEKAFALGSLAGARHLPFAALAERAAELVRFKSRPVLIVCEAGQQSARAIATFKSQGFDEAHSLAGGIAAWKQAGLPLVQAGRESARSVPKEQARKSRDQRSGERARAKAARTTLPATALSAAGTATVVGSVVDGEVVDAAVEAPAVDRIDADDRIAAVVEDDAAASAGRLKELSR